MRVILTHAVEGDDPARTQPIRTDVTGDRDGVYWCGYGEGMALDVDVDGEGASGVTPESLIAVVVDYAERVLEQRRPGPSTQITEDLRMAVSYLKAGLELLKAKGKMRIIYTTTERFTNEVITGNGTPARDGFVAVRVVERLSADLARHRNPWTVQIWSNTEKRYVGFCHNAPITLDKAEKRVDELRANKQVGKFRVVPWLNQEQRTFAASEYEPRIVDVKETVDEVKPV